LEKMASDRTLTAGHIGHEVVVMDPSIKPDGLYPERKVHRREADACPLHTDVAEALFEVHRLEAIVEDLAVVVARVGRVTAGIGDVEDRLDHLERTFGP
jgi:hypothetical protein